MRIVHISDLHIGRAPRSWRACCDKRLLGTLNYLVRRARHFRLEYWERALVEIQRLKPELVICTGDLTCVGSPEELAEAGELLAPLRLALDHRFLVLPGNHDAYVGARDCRAALATTFQHLNGERWSLAALPLERTVGGLRLLLVDAAHPTSCVSSGGTLSAATQEWLAQRLAAPREDGECRVLVSHFPLRGADGRPLSPRRRMAGAEALWRHYEAQRLDLVLSGHIHSPFALWESDGRGQVCAGSLTLEGRFSVLDWTPGTRHFRQWFEDVRGSRGEPLVPAIEGRLAPVS